MSDASGTSPRNENGTDPLPGLRTNRPPRPRTAEPSVMVESTPTKSSTTAAPFLPLFSWIASSAFSDSGSMPTSAPSVCASARLPGSASSTTTLAGERSLRNCTPYWPSPPAPTSTALVPAVRWGSVIFYRRIGRERSVSERRGQDRVEAVGRQEVPSRGNQEVLGIAAFWPYPGTCRTSVLCRRGRNCSVHSPSLRRPRPRPRLPDRVLQRRGRTPRPAAFSCPRV